MGLPEALQWQEERDLSLVGNGSSSVEVSTTKALESVDVATLPSRLSSNGGIPTRGRPTCICPAGSWGPCFPSDTRGAEGKRERELYEIASALCLKEFLEEEDVEFDVFQQRIMARYQSLMQAPAASSSSSDSSSDSGSDSGSGSRNSISSGSESPVLLKDKAGLLAECRLLIDSLEAMEAEDEQKSVMRARLVKFMVNLETAIDASEALSEAGVSQGGRLEDLSLPGMDKLRTDLEKAGLVDVERSPTEGGNKNETEIKKALQEIFAQEDVTDAKTTAERLVKTYFDVPSRQGVGVSREGAGRFQRDVLSGLAVVNSVYNCDGATIYEVQPKAPNTFTDDLYSMWEGSSMKEEVAYTVILNEKVPNFDSGFEQAALDMMLGASPCVILYPSSWNSTIEASNDQPFVKLWQSFLSSSTVVSSGIFAGNCLNMFDLEGPFAKTGELPDDFLSGPSPSGDTVVD